MTERERVLAVLEGSAPDKTPWFGDMSWWYSARMHKGTLPAEYGNGEEGYLKMHRDAGVGIYLYAPFLWTQEYDETVTVNTRVEGKTTVTVLSTPLGELRSAAQELPESGTSALVEYYVKRPEDLQIMRYVHRHRIIRPDYDSFHRCDALWDGWGLPCVLAPVCTTPLQSLLSRWAGVETTVALYSSAREEFERTLYEIQEADDDIFAILCRGPGRFVVFPENLSGEVTGRNLIRKYEMSYWRKRIGSLHDAGKSVGIHNDGTLRASLPLLIEAGFDIVEAATPAPVGDMSVGEIRRMTAGKLIVWGCLPGALFSPLYAEGEFVAYVREVLETFPVGSGFVLGVADQIPPDAEFSRIRLVRELVEREG